MNQQDLSHEAIANGIVNIVPELIDPKQEKKLRRIMLHIGHFAYPGQDRVEPPIYHRSAVNVGASVWDERGIRFDQEIYRHPSSTFKIKDIQKKINQRELEMNDRPHKAVWVVSKDPLTEKYCIEVKTIYLSEVK